MRQFPIPFKEVLKKSKLTHDQIAERLKLSKHRWQNIFYGLGRMDEKEFKDVKNLVEQLNRNVTNVQTTIPE
jgi:hypothetical protein